MLFAVRKHFTTVTAENQYRQKGFSMANSRLRSAAGAAGIPLWRIAQELGYNDSAFSRKLRNELPPELQERALVAIERLAEQEGKYGANR